VRNEAEARARRLGRTGHGGSGGGGRPGGGLLGGRLGGRLGRTLDYGGVGGRLRNEPNSRVFRFGRIGYGGVHFGLVLPAESLAAFQFPQVGEEGPLGIDGVTVEPVEGFGVVGEPGAELGAPFGFEGDGHAVVDEVGGEEAVATQQPVVFDEDVDEKALDEADGLELVVVLVGESGESGGAFAGGGFVDGVDAGFESVHARDGFTLFGARAGGELRISAIGRHLFLGWHRASFSLDGSRRGRAFSGGRTGSD